MCPALLRMVSSSAGESNFTEYVAVEGGTEEDKGLGEEVRLVAGTRFWVWLEKVSSSVCA